MLHSVVENWGWGGLKTQTTPLTDIKIFTKWDGHSRWLVMSSPRFLFYHTHTLQTRSHQPRPPPLWSSLNLHHGLEEAGRSLRLLTTSRPWQVTWLPHTVVPLGLSFLDSAGHLWICSLQGPTLKYLLLFTVDSISCEELCWSRSCRSISLTFSLFKSKLVIINLVAITF